MTKFEVFMQVCATVGMLTILFVSIMFVIYIVRSSWAALVRNRQLNDENDTLSREVIRLRESLKDSLLENHRLRDVPRDQDPVPQEDILS